MELINNFYGNEIIFKIYLIFVYYIYVLGNGFLFIFLLCEKIIMLMCMFYKLNILS